MNTLKKVIKKIATYMFKTRRGEGGGVVKGTLQFFTYDCPMYFSFLMIGRGWAPVGLGSGGAGGQINDDVRSPFGPISWRKEFTTVSPPRLL